MHKPNKLTTTKGRSKTTKISYLDRYKHQQDVGNGTSYKANLGGKSQWNEEELSERRDRIIDKLYRENEVSRIRIQEESMQSQFMKDDYLDLELMWYKKIHQIEEQTEKIRISDRRESRAIRTLEEDLHNKQNMERQLQVKLEEEQHRASITTIAFDEEDQNQMIYRQLLRSVEEGQRQLVVLKAEKAQLEQYNAKLKATVEKLQNQITDYAYLQYLDISEQKLAEVEQYVQEEQEEYRSLQVQNSRIQNVLKARQSQNQQYQEQNGFDIKIQEDLFIIRELDKLDQLMTVKQNQIRRAEKFEENKDFYKSKMKEVEVQEKQNKKKKKTITELTEKIKQISIEMLNSYQ